MLEGGESTIIGDVGQVAVRVFQNHFFGHFYSEVDYKTVGWIACYSFAGGLKAIAFTNVFQMTLLIIVSLMLMIAGLDKVGGISELITKTPNSYWNLFQPMDDANYPWLAILLGYPVMGVWFWCTDQSMVQSVLGAKNLKQGQLVANFTSGSIL